MLMRWSKGEVNEIKREIEEPNDLVGNGVQIVNLDKEIGTVG